MKSLFEEINFSSFLRLVAINLISLVVIPYIIKIGFLALGLNPPAAIIFFFIFTAWLLFLLYSKDRFTFVLAGALTADFCIVGFLLAHYIFDFSFDGQGYHQEAIIALAEGWNFLWEDLTFNPSDLWIKHYPKSQWLSSSFYFDLTNSIEAAKITNILLCFAKLCLGIIAFRKIGLKSNLIILIISLLVAFDPVNLNTLFSHTNDGQVSSGLILIIYLLIINHVKKDKSLLVLLALLIVYTVNIKFNALAYVGILFFAYLAYLLFFEKRKVAKEQALIFFSAIILAVNVFGYQPYVKNIIQHGNIFYPVINNDSPNDNLAFDYIPSNLIEKSRVERLLYSSFATSSFSQSFNKPIALKAPFVVSEYEITRYAGTGIMIGGLGPWFSGLLCISLILIIYMLFHFKSYKKYLFVVACIIISVIANPACWWFRFVPQYWLIFIVLFIPIYQNAKLKKLANFFLLLIALNSFLMCGYFAYQVWASNQLVHQMKELKEDFNPSIPYNIQFNRHRASFMQKLRRFEIDYRENEETECLEIMTFKLIEAKVCK